MSQYISKNPLVQFGTITTSTTYTSPPAETYTFNGNTYYYYASQFVGADNIMVSKERHLIYRDMYYSEKHLITHDFKELNRMLESPDIDTVKLAIEIIKGTTKFLRAYLEVLWVHRSSYLQDIIIQEFINYTHGRL